MSCWTHVFAKAVFVMKEGEAFDADNIFGKELKIDWGPKDWCPRYFKKNWKKLARYYPELYEKERLRIYHINRKRYEKYMESEKHKKNREKERELWEEYQGGEILFMPVGREGSCTRKIFKKKRKKGGTYITVKIEGHLRDYASEEAPVEWFRNCIENLRKKAYIESAKVSASFVGTETWSYENKTDWYSGR